MLLREEMCLTIWKQTVSRLDFRTRRFILKPMKDAPQNTLIISLRLKDGWSKPVPNIDTQKCDIDGAQLWIGPGDQIYCDLIHDTQD
jgi:hypothetical protein